MIEIQQAAIQAAQFGGMLADPGSAPPPQCNKGTPAMALHFDFKKVTRYVLTCRDHDGVIGDLGEYSRRDEVERVLGMLRSMPAEEAAGEAEFRYRLHNAPAIKYVEADGTLTLTGCNGRDILTLLPGASIKNVDGTLVEVPAEAA